MRSVWLLGLVFAVGCFEPEPPIGVECALGERCPPGQFCNAATNLCEVTPSGDLSCDDWSYQPQLVDPCDVPLPDRPLILSEDVSGFDVDIGVLFGASDLSFDLGTVDVSISDIGVAVISVSELSIDASSFLELVGTQPLLIVSWGDTVIDGVLSANAIEGVPGAGAAPRGPACQYGPDVNITPTSGFGGGGGLGGNGGAGGNSAMSSNGGEPVAPGFHGGCPGDGPDGGGGGGVIAVVTRNQMVVNGQVSAGGGGGATGGTLHPGGFGGGAGGLILFEADNLEVGGTVSANGGGGGGGADNGVTGGAGSDGLPGSEPAPGGSAGGPVAGTGGDGGAGSVTDGRPGLLGGDATAGGGGGGGAAGGILLLSPRPIDTNGADLSPR